MTLFNNNMTENRDHKEVLPSVALEPDELSNEELRIFELELELQLLSIQRVKKERELETLRSCIDTNKKVTKNTITKPTSDQYTNVRSPIGMTYAGGTTHIYTGDVAELITKSKSGHFRGISTVKIVGRSTQGTGDNVTVCDPDLPQMQTYRSPRNLRKKQNQSNTL